jgi:hypothetical protein
VTWCFSQKKDVNVEEIQDASLTEAIPGHGRAKNRNIGNSVFIELSNVGNNLYGHNDCTIKAIKK